MKKKLSNCVVLLITLSLFVVCTAIWLQVTGNYKTQLIRTEHSLRIARRDIATFKDVVGRYPKTLTEMTEYARTHQKLYLHGKMFGEFLSDSRGNRTEHTRLNNKGGYYYDPNNGEVKVNLTKPVGHYIRLYFGKKRNEVPAGW